MSHSICYCSSQEDRRIDRSRFCTRIFQYSPEKKKAYYLISYLGTLREDIGRSLLPRITSQSQRLLVLLLEVPPPFSVKCFSGCSWIKCFPGCSWDDVNCLNTQRKSSSDKEHGFATKIYIIYIPACGQQVSSVKPLMNIFISIRCTQLVGQASVDI